MKVGTDSIMLGSWVQTNNAQRILDIGTGSGLLAIMLAQKALDSCLIDGIDIDETAISQANINAQKCPWANQLTFEHISLQQLSFTAGYDLIVSNPPYFPINISANKIQLATNRPIARQTIELEHPILLQEVNKHLSNEGRFCCVLPEEVVKSFSVNAESLGLFCTRELQVQPKHQSNVTRLLLEFNRNQATKTIERLCIYNHLGSYSAEYRALCKDYYLKF